MDADAIADLFSPVGRVGLRRMFGGHGVYLQDRIFAIESDGMVWLKVDATNQPLFEARGARPFTHVRRDGSVATMSYWSLPETAYDDAEELRVLTLSALDAAARNAVRPRKTRRRQP
jgi:DNA transformation protein and related proteins